MVQFFDYCKDIREVTGPVKSLNLVTRDRKRCKESGLPTWATQAFRGY